MGYGDDLMVTGEVKSLQQKYPNSKFIVGDGKQSYERLLERAKRFEYFTHFHYPKQHNIFYTKYIESILDFK